MSYLAIDPGIDTGWAYFRSATELVACGVGNPRELRGHPIRTVIIERPMIYKASLMKGDPNLIVTLAIQVGKYAGHFEERGARVALVAPSSWKGQVPKDIHNARTIAALTPAQKALVDAQLNYIAPSKRHNAIDAIALGFAAFKMKLWSQ